jgi:hypothetical protein
MAKERKEEVESRNQTEGGDTLRQGVTILSELTGVVRQNAADRRVSLTPVQTPAMPDLLLWFVIKRTTEALSFNNYRDFMDSVLCGDRTRLNGFDVIDGVRRSLGGRRYLPYTDTDAYRLLKVATEAFLTVNCGVPLIHPASINSEAPDLLSGPLAGLDLDDLLKSVNGLGNSALVNQWWNDYLQAVNGNANLTLPYLMLIRKKLRDEPIIELVFNTQDRTWSSEEERLCYGILVDKLAMPCFIELIWSYWYEQGMLVQTINAISRRFQNVRGPGAQDPLAMVEIDPLRPLNNLLWGYIQDEQHRLSVVRRAHEYVHHYGLTLEGKAVPTLRPADSRSKFLEVFHHLLGLAWSFYKQDDDTTVKADGFPILNSLRDVHMLLAEGAHNQFGDLPATARIEMLMQQWLLARPEFREVLPTRIMVAYPEPWMDRVDAMKKLQGWHDTSILQFHNLAIYGEQILLSIRYGAWSETDLQPEQAAIWARFWRKQIQGYLYAYHTVTGVDLTAKVVNPQDLALRVAQPSALLRQRLSMNGARPQLSTELQGTAPLLPFRERRAVKQ